MFFLIQDGAQETSPEGRPSERAGPECAVARRRAEWEELCGECPDWSVVQHKLSFLSFANSAIKAKSETKTAGVWLQHRS